MDLKLYSTPPDEYFDNCLIVYGCDTPELQPELKKYFDTKQDDFMKKSKDSYNPQANYETDRGSFLVNQQISNVNTYRSDVWNYLTDEFNKNTNTKFVNARAIEQNKKTSKSILQKFKPS